MAKTKPKNKKQQKAAKSVLNRVSGTTSSASPSTSTNNAAAAAPKPTVTAASLLLKATSLLQTGDIEGALKPAKKALAQLDGEKIEALPALNLLGEIYVERGDIEKARAHFLRAAAIDHDMTIAEGLGGGAEKFLWLAQLSEEGGQDSVDWFEKGATSLRMQIEALSEAKGKKGVNQHEVEAMLVEKREKLAVALCGVVEVYMTDLSWAPRAEETCEALVTEATMVAPELAEAWQTLANVRISQERMEDACAALGRSLELWKDLEPGSERVPEFAARVSLARLLMEVGMGAEALEVLERLVGEDDTAVEVWYLGGWGLFVMGGKLKNGEVEAEVEEDAWKILWISARQWLKQSQTLYQQQEYEDERLGEHAQELLEELNKELGAEGTNDEEDGDDWEDDDGSEDEEMEDS